MVFNASPFERMTALTDLILGLVALYVLLQLRSYEGFKATIWVWAFGLLALASFLGVAAHGFEMSAETNRLIWQPLNLSLGLALGFFVVGTVFDLFGEQPARSTMPFMVLAGLAFYLVTVFVPGTFMTFIAYEAVAMLFALGGYIYLTSQNTLPGSIWMTLGVLITIIAAVVQALGPNNKSILWQFDNNGIFHLIQFVGILVLHQGLKIALEAPAKP